MQKWAITDILDTMHEMYKDFPVTELNYYTPFQCLIAVMMSAQTTDVQVNKVTDALFQKIKSPVDVLAMWEEELGEHIRTVWLWTAKKKNIYQTAKILVTMSQKQKEEKRSKRIDDHCTLQPSTSSGWQTHEECHPERSVAKSKGVTKTHHEVDLVCKDSQEVLERFGYYIPDTIYEIMELPGVGIKTAKVVLYVLYRQRRVAVDTHVHRVMNRLGVVDTKFPDQSSVELETIIPDEYKDIAHHSIIYFGRYHCKAKKPNCSECPLQKWCIWYQKNNT